MLSPQTIQVNIQHILHHHFSRLANLPLCNDYTMSTVQDRSGRGEGWGGEDQGEGRGVG